LTTRNSQKLVNENADLNRWSRKKTGKHALKEKKKNKKPQEPSREETFTGKNLKATGASKKKGPSCHFWG